MKNLRDTERNFMALPATSISTSALMRRTRSQATRCQVSRCGSGQRKTLSPGEEHVELNSSLWKANLNKGNKGEM